MKNFKIFISGLVSALVVLVVPLVVFGVNISDGIISSWGLTTDASQPANIVVGIINVVLSFLGIITICLVIYGGFLYLLARGNPKTADKGRKVIFIGIIGVLIVLASWGISYFVFSAINQSVDEAGGSGGGSNECLGAGGVCTTTCLGNNLGAKGCPVGQTCCQDSKVTCSGIAGCSCQESCDPGETETNNPGCGFSKTCCCLK